MPCIEARGLRKRFGSTVALDGVDLRVDEGRILGIVGPNGAGKSTLLKAILGLAPLTSGRVTMFGEPLDRVRGRVAYVPQRESVDWDFPISVLDVVLMGTYGRLGWLPSVRSHHPFEPQDHELRGRA